MTKLISDTFENTEKKKFLVIDSISKSYKTKEHTKQILDKLSFQVEKGCFVTIFGPNGCGKTTLFNLIAGLVEPDTNIITVDGKPTKKSRISFMFQNSSDTLLPWRTCLENIAFPLELNGIRKSERIEKVNTLLTSLNIDIPLYQYPYQCSGGQKQLVAIARALIQNPDLLLMDEPFSALDYERRLEMENKLLDIFSKTKVTTLLISHDIDEAVYLSDKIIIFSKMPARVEGEVVVNLPRPRKQDIMETTEFYNIRTEVLRKFYSVIRK